MIVPGANKEAIASYVREMFDKLRMNRLAKEEIWLECIRAYLCDFDQAELDASPNRSHRFYSLTHDAVESIHSQLMAMILPDDRWMFIEPEIPGKLPHDDKAAEQAYHLLDIRTKRSRFREVASSIIKQLAITGNCPYSVSLHQEYAANFPAFREAMVKWEQLNREQWMLYMEQRRQYEMAAREAQRLGLEPPPPPVDLAIPELPAVTDQELVYSGPRMEMGDLFNFVVDPYSTDPRTALRIRRIWVSRETIKQLAEKNESGYAVYEGIDKLDTLTETDMATAKDAHITDRIANAYGLTMPSKDAVEMYEAWGTMEIPMGDSDGRSTFVAYTATVANGQTIRFEPTFFWTGEAPLQLATYNNVPGQVYGIGPIEPNLGLQSLANARANQLVDVAAYAINPEKVIVLDGVINPRLTSAPGRNHPAADVKNMKVLEKDMRGVQIGHQDLELVAREFRAMTKAMSPMMGRGSQTATRTALDANIIGTDLGKIAGWIEDTFITKALDLYVQIDRQFMDRNEIAKYTQSPDSPLKDLSPESFMAGMAIRARGSKHFADRMEQAQGLAAFISMTANSSILAPAVNFLHLGRKYYQLLGFHDVDEAFNSPERAQQILDQMFEAGLIGRGGNGNDPGLATDAGGSAAASPTATQPASRSGSGQGDEGSGPGQSGVSQSGNNAGEQS